MKKPSRMSVCLGLSFGIALAGCATVDIPARLPGATEVLSTANGGWVVITTAGKVTRRGELIALGRDTIFIMDHGALTLTPSINVLSAKLFLTDYPVTPGGAGVWTALGVVSSASLGFGAIFAAPLWLLVGGINTSVVARDADEGDLAFPPAKLEEFSMFARYPQGLPEGVDRSMIRPAPFYLQSREQEPAD
jgi:hypothetical protein